MRPLPSSSISLYCPEWTDNERMKVMFAPMRPKELNPESWNSKMAFWKSLIARWCLENEICGITIDLLQKAFTREGIVPHCLKEVLEDAVKSGEFTDQARYTDYIKPKTTWRSWSTNLMWNTVQSVGDRLVGHNPNNIIIPSVAEKLMDDKLSILKSIEPVLKLDQCMFISEDQIRNLHNNISTELLDLLCARRVIASSLIDGKKYFKISEDNSVIDFREKDEGVIKLMKTQHLLNEEIEDLESQAKVMENKIKQLLKTDSRQSAKSLLRRKKNIENLQNEKMNQKLNTETLLDQIIGADSNRMVLDSYRSGLGALKSSLEDKSFVDVDNLMDEIGDTLSKGEDLTVKMSKSMLDDSLSSDELEKELNDLSKEESDLDVSKELSKITSEEDEELLEMLEKLDCQIPTNNFNTNREKIALPSC